MHNSLKYAAVAIVAAATGLATGSAASATAAPSSPPRSATAASHAVTGPWHTSWAQSQDGRSTATLTNQSIRMITHLSQGGDAVRFRVQNQFGTTALRIGRAAVALTDGQSAAVRPGTTRAATFGGRSSVTVAPGKDAWSDPIPLRTASQADLAVSLFTSGTIQPSQHFSAMRHNYVTSTGAGDQTRQADGSAYTSTVDQTYLVSAVDTFNTSVRGTIVAYGSSVVDGAGSDNCGGDCRRSGNNQRWTDDLGARINQDLPGHQQLSVANAGIGGTLSSTQCPGESEDAKRVSGVPRLDRDVLALHGVTGVVFFYGTNDLAAGCTGDQILASYRTIFQRLHAHGIKVYVAASTPRPSYTDQQNRYRWQVGQFVANQGDCGGLCDGVVDFDQAIKDPVKPNSINPAFDNGDGIHANIAGQKAEADTISLSMLASSTRR